jgi:hypothetical protein
MRSLMLFSSELEVVWWIVISLLSVNSPMSLCLPSSSSALSSTLGSPWSANVISLFVMKLRACSWSLNAWKSNLFTSTDAALASDDTDTVLGVAAFSVPVINLLACSRDLLS